MIRFWRSFPIAMTIFMRPILNQGNLPIGKRKAVIRSAIASFAKGGIYLESGLGRKPTIVCWILMRGVRIIPAAIA
jgi:hypothetical protein